MKDRKLTTIRRWAVRGLFERPEAPERAPSIVPPLHEEMGIQVRTRMVRYRGLTSYQCEQMLPVSEACGWSRRAHMQPVSRDRKRKTA